MAYVKMFLRVNIIFIFLLPLLKIKVCGDKIYESIYKPITSIYPCVALLNATHQIGCTSKRKGNVGVVHYIDSDESFDWLLTKGKHSPYIPLFTAEYFTDDRLKKLINADKVSGALVLYDQFYNINGTTPPNSGFSPEYPCPNDNFGLYGNGKYSCSGKGSQSVIWNVKGSEMSYRDYGIPVFAISKEKEIKNLIKCYNDHNKPVNDKNPDYPLCGVESMIFMHAAKDTPTCMRKSEMSTYSQTVFCDPLGDYNVWGTLFSLYKANLTHNDIIMATAKLDSTGFFHDIAPGGDNGVSGIVVLLAAADLLGILRRNGSIKAPDLKKNQKHIMFSFFQGEVWDYIGSSRMVYDMKNGDFPNCEDCIKPRRFDLSNIAYYLEMSQVGLLDENFWAHRDPESPDQAREKTKEMFDILSEVGVSVNLSIKDPSESKLQPLPPASFQRFLKGNRSIPGLVITDHKAAYTNKFYNSRFDDIKNVNVKHMTKLATAVAKTLLKLAYNETKEHIVASEDRVQDLVYCLLHTANCSLFKNVVPKTSAKNLASHKVPLPRYVGPYNKATGPSAISVMTKHLLAYFTRIALNSTKCNSGKQDVDFAYQASNGLCIEANVYFSPAKSPAFLLETYDSVEYSTWTESRWGTDIRVRMFLVADPAQEAITLAVGIILTLISLVVTVFMYRKAEQLFTPGDTVLVIVPEMIDGVHCYHRQSKTWTGNKYRDFCCERVLQKHSGVSFGLVYNRNVDIN